MPIQINSFNQQHHNIFDKVVVNLFQVFFSGGCAFSPCICIYDLYAFV